MDKEKIGIKKLENSYNEVPYASKTFYNSQPGKLKVNMRLVDFDTPELDSARVLEIGCSFGGNIIPFALAYPNSKVVGLDLSEIQVNKGNKLIDSLGIDNIKLYHKNILDYEGEFGEFDYIICHGVYSWVPDIVQDAILKAIKNSLSPNGVALVSYNTYPGWKTIEVARDVMLFRDKYLKKKGVDVTTTNRVPYGKGILEFLEKNSKLNDKIKGSFKDISDKDEYYILHEYYEEYNKPMYICDFAEKLLENGLSHVMDSNFYKTFPSFGNEVDEILEKECNGDYILKEQYNDLMLDNTFRNSIITHSENIQKMTISKNIKISNLKLLNFRGRYLKNENGKYEIKGNKVSDDIEINEILGQLTKVYPSTITIDKLFKNMEGKIAINKISVALLELVYSGDVQAFTKEINIISEEKLALLPRYRKYLEYFSTEGEKIITLSGFSGLAYELKDTRVVAGAALLFDGEKTDEDIFEILKEKLKNGEIKTSSIEPEKIEKDILDFIKMLRGIIEENLFNIEKK